MENIMELDTKYNQSMIVDSIELWKAEELISYSTKPEIDNITLEVSHIIRRIICNYTYKNKRKSLMIMYDDIENEYDISLYIMDEMSKKYSYEKVFNR
jgi:hypothetical protein